MYRHNFELLLKRLRKYARIFLWFIQICFETEKTAKRNVRNVYTFIYCFLYPLRVGIGERMRNLDVWQVLDYIVDCLYIIYQ